MQLIKTTTVNNDITISLYKSALDGMYFVSTKIGHFEDFVSHYSCYTDANTEYKTRIIKAI